MKDILLIGAGGHCKSCIDVIEAHGEYRIKRVFRPVGDVGDFLFDFPADGSDSELPEALQQTPYALVTVGQIKSATTRANLFERLLGLGAILPTIVSPAARRSPRASLGCGTIVMHNAVINAGAEIGQNCIVNTMALVEHDAVISSHCHISTGARVNGGVKIGEGVFIGSGAVLKEGIHVADGAVIGAGQVVLNDVKAGEVVRR